MEVQSGMYIKPEKMSLSTFIEKEWLPKYALDTSNLSPLALKTYLCHIKNHINPNLGDYYLEDIKTIHLVTFINNLKKSGVRKDKREDTLSDGTVGYIYRVFKNILERATEWNFIKKNPMAGVKKPTARHKEFNFYDEDEAKQVIAALNTELRKWRLFILGSMLGGFRRSELIALEWSDIDFEDMTIHIRKSISLTET